MSRPIFRPRRQSSPAQKTPAPRAHFTPPAARPKSSPAAAGELIGRIQFRAGGSAFVTPEGVPFYAGTYFPPEPRHGLPAWRQVVAAIGEAWRDQREEITKAGASILPRPAT